MKQIITLSINGHINECAAEPRDTLLETIRKLGYKGAKEGCGLGECGSCTVLIDGVPALSCLVLAIEVQGAAITTIEGLARDGAAHPIQEAFVVEGAIQCGFCTPGMILASKALLDAVPEPDRDEIDRAIGGHVCRCTGYIKIREAIRVAGGRLRSGGQEQI